MNKFVVKLFLFFMVLLTTITITQAYITGPIAKQNTDMAMKQFDGVPATAGDINVADLWISVNAIQVFIALCIGLLAFVMFGNDVVTFFKKRRK